MKPHLGVLQTARLALGVGILCAFLGSGCSGRDPADARIRVGCKNFSEQLILGEMMALLLEHEGLSVERKFGLGSTRLIHEALVTGEIDLYAEYTGTAAQNILALKSKADLTAIREIYRARFQAEWLQPFGFNNTYAIAVRAADADRKKWTRISDLATESGSLRAGFNAEFLERADGWPGLKSAYQLNFGTVVNLDAGLVCQALRENKVDVISAFATDGRLDEYRFRVLDDDHGFFPHYDPAPVVRQQTLLRHPVIRVALEKLPGLLDDARMRGLNFRVDGEGLDPRRVARDFLVEKKLL